MYCEKKMYACIRSLDASEIEKQSMAVLTQIIQMRCYAASHCISVYISKPTGELQTMPLINHALANGKRIFCPRVMSDGCMEMLEVSSEQEISTLPLSKWGIPEPFFDKPIIEPHNIDLLVVPVVALDLERRRCGHGLGFYDRYIRRARLASSGRNVHVMGVALLQQLVERVPIEMHDELLDSVVIPDSGSALCTLC